MTVSQRHPGASIADTDRVDSSAAGHFRDDGWVLIPGVVTSDELATIRAALELIYPTYDDLERFPEKHAWARDGQFGGLRLWPLDNLILDLLPLDERFVGIAESLIGSEDIGLLRAGYQAKYSSTVDFDQPLHFDYPNHSLVVPAEDDIVGFFLYLCDVNEDLGPTMLVSDHHRGPLTPERTHLVPAQDWAELYSVERAATGEAGSLLAYRSTTLHRGSAITAARAVRLTLGFAYGRGDRWNGFMSVPRLGEEEGLRRVVAAATPRQRQLLGFPPPQHPYWTPAALSAVAARYPGFDTSPYVAEAPA